MSVLAAALYGGTLLLSGWLATIGLELAARARLRERLVPEAVSPRSSVPLAQRVGHLFRSGRFELALLSAAGSILGYQLVGPVGLAIGAAAGPLVQRLRGARAAARARDALDRELGEAIATVSAAVRAGLSVRRAVAAAAGEAAPPLRQRFASVLQGLDTGEPLDAALARLSRKLPLADASLVVTALSVHGRTGGDLPSLLDAIGDVIRQRRSDRRAIEALTAQARSSGVVLAVLPIAFVALLSGTGGDDLGAFYRTGTGAVLLLVALGLQALGFLWMRRIVRWVEGP